MFNQGTWLTQVNSELKWGAKQPQLGRKRRFNLWHILSVTLTVVIVVVVLTYFARQSYFDTSYVWYLLAWLPFIMLGLAHHVVRREWQHQTYGWWLALPLSRLRLVMTKFIATCLQSLLIATVMFIAIAIIGIYMMIVQQEMDVIHFILRGLLLFSLAICSLPILTAFGMLSATLVQSYLKGLLPLLWLGFWLASSGAIWLLYMGVGTSALIGMIILSLLITYAIMCWNSWILKSALDL